MSIVEQRNYRYAYLLWEFWKKDNELFPGEIMSRKKDLSQEPHSLIFVFDGSLDQVPNGQEEIKFYRDIINKARARSIYIIFFFIFIAKIIIYVIYLASYKINLSISIFF